MGVEANEQGDKAASYLYCVESICPECGMHVPMAPSWVIGKGTRTVALLQEDGLYYNVSIKMNATQKEMKDAEIGTVTSRGIVCPHCKTVTPISVLRHDRIGNDGKTTCGLRQWNKKDYKPEKNDVFQERLYAIKYVKSDGKRYYCAPSSKDIRNEEIIDNFINDHISEWQDKGYIPCGSVESGNKTDEVRNNRGWMFWHQLYSPRQLFLIGLFVEAIDSLANTTEEIVAGILGIHRLNNFNSKLSRFNPGAGVEKVVDVFFNQAMSPLYNYGCLGMESVASCWKYNINNYPIDAEKQVLLRDARSIDKECDYWITDPPYADAIMYHELSEFFIAWDRTLLVRAFPDWYTDSKRILAVRGDEHFSQTMIDIYSNLTHHMNDDGMQIVMFTHSDPAVWAQLALIMWKAGLTVTAAWNIATETDASGLKDGNYVKGTVLLVLRKQQGNDEAFLDELSIDIKNEVKNQIESMQKLDDKEDPNFSDPDYVLAAYAASLKVLTGYKAIGEIDLDYELNLAIHEPSKSEVVKLIERAKKIAYDFIIPIDFDNFLWKELTPAERFYIKGLEAEKHGNYQISTYQEYARGFGLSGYGQMMASEKANTARLKTPQEFAMRNVNEVPDFEESTLRLVLAAIHVASKEDENPEKGLWHIKNNIADYWNKRDMLKTLLAFLKDAENIDTMPHWRDAAVMASHIYTLVDNDHI